ncbi:MAG: TAXI family TRAP transporter solute-binding subunit [Gammaproteobacteria bacterium]|nr:TAXI family TRAP transporter solute-binding subunit [Gammaproteobacteria bacterium]
MTTKKWIPVLFLLFSCFVTVAQKNTVTISTAELEKIIDKAAKQSAKQAINDVLKQQQKTKKSSANITKDLPSQANATKTLRIGSGSIGGNYFVLGELVGGVVSHPIGSLPCGSGGSCGVPSLQSQNVTSAGSVANLNALQQGSIHTGFVQSDIAYSAYTGSGLYANEKKIGNLRAIASLYPEAIHIIIRKDASVLNIAELVGKRVSLGAKNSGTLQGAKLVLEAYDISEDKLKAQYLNSTDSIKGLLKGDLDAVFFTVGPSSPILNQLFENSDEFTLLPIDKMQRQAIFKQGHYFSPYTIATNTYKGVPKTDTISVYALWLTTDEADEKLVYELTKSLWGAPATQLFESSLIGRYIDVENSLKGIGIPLHSGAKKYYDEIGKRF